MKPYRAATLNALLAGMLLVPMAATADPATEALVELLDTGLKEKKSVVIYLDGQAVPGRVTRLIGQEAVEMTSREYSRILIRIDRINGVSLL